MIGQQYPATVQSQKPSVGHAPWWISQQALSAEKKKFKKQTFAEALKDFLQNVSLHCYGKLVEPGRRFQERFFWLIFHAVALAILIIFLWNTYSDDSRLLSTTIYDPLYPITKVAFPAISICSINRISNASAMRYAEELNAKDPLKRGVSYFYERIHMLSYNYYMIRDNLNFEEALDLQRILDLYDTKDNELFYNTRRRMAMLTPRCRDILLECRLGGFEINCSKQFVESLTGRGICCTFNLDGKYSGERSFEMRFFGYEQGLVLLLNSSTKDTFFHSTYFDGFIAMVYPHTDYPDVSSGAVTEHLVLAGFDNHIHLDAKIIETVSEARFLSPRTRNCYFADESPREYGKRYSFNKCITRCRVRSVLILCGCLAFQIPHEFLDAATNTVYCTLQHVECLNRYNFKWLNVITRREMVTGLEHEMEDSLYCPYCLPSCTQTRYSAGVTAAKLNAYNMRTFSKHLNKSNDTDLAVLKVGFTNTHVFYYRQILTNSWFEIFSNIGNICGIITGFSLITFCEIIYFFIRQFWTAWNDESFVERRAKRKRKNLKVNSKEMKREELLILP